MFYGKEKTGPTVGAEEPVKTKNYIAGESFGDSEPTEEVPQAPLTDVQKQWHLVHDAYQRGYTQGLLEGLAQGPTHPAVQISVANMFGDWKGAEAARQQSSQRFTNWYRKARDAA